MQHTDTVKCRRLPGLQEDHHHDGRGFDGLWKGRRGARWRIRLMPAIAAQAMRIVTSWRVWRNSGAMTEPDVRSSWFSYISFRGRDDSAEARAKCEVVRSGSITGGFRPGRFFELAFHAGQAEKEDPPEADGKERNYERNGEQLLTIPFRSRIFPDEERLKRAERNHVQAKQSATLAHKRATRWPHGFN